MGPSHNGRLGGDAVHLGGVSDRDLPPQTDRTAAGANVTDMLDRPFRFGVIGAPFGKPDHWRATAVRAAELGYTTLLMPDVLNLLAPGPTLGVAAGVADIGVGTWVYSAPLRTPQQTAWEAHTLSVLTGGRFEMGIGTGHPRSGEFARTLGMPFGSAAKRLAQVSATIEAVHELDGPDVHTRILVAAGGPKARALAAEKADIVSIAADPLTPRQAVAEATAEVRAKAGTRAGDIEFAMNLFAVGDDIPPHAKQATGADPEELVAADSLVLLRGDTAAMIDQLRRRREQIGVSYILVNAEFMAHLAPVVEALTGT
jgi:alkanesulfonate monooxygenase SsuD/methylene tetrahydromethanopterin reductase-like flavin-dependent oxidoreductase (luciferase family)